MSPLSVSAHTAPDDFLATAEPLLAADPARTSVLATATGRISRLGAPEDLTPTWWVVHSSDEIAGLGMHTRRGRPYVVAARGHDAVAVGAALAQAVPDDLAEVVTGVNGFTGSARGFADVWTRRHGGTVRQGRQDLLYVLDGPVNAPHEVPGRARPAGDADVEWVRGWARDFIRDIGDPPDPTATIDQPLADGRVLVWEADGEPTAMAAANPPYYGHVRISWAWVPPHLRDHGYGGAVTAAVCSEAYAAGNTPLLHVAAANPAGNAVYRRLGFGLRDELSHLHIDR